MRYYSVQISNASSGAEIQTYTSFVNNQTLPGALNVELDIPVVPFATPAGDAFVRVWGISIDQISQSSDLNGAAISVYGGMQKGLPLANPQQAGLIAQGYILQALGNWINTDQTLDLIITAAPTKTTPPNITFDWKKGSTLSSAIQQTLSTAYPNYKLNISINSNLVLTQDEPGYYQNLTQFAQYIKQRSAAIIGGDYKGVDIFLTQTNFNVFDGTTQTSPRQLQFQDLIGQPTWIDPTTVQAKFVMRADLSVGDYIKFPKSLVISQAATTSPFVNQKLTFQGTFLVNQIRHVGNFRQPDAASWVTVVNATSTAPVSST